MSKSSSRGRPRGGSDARERIRQAARERFLADGYHAASLRAIAQQANVDVALLSYHFGSKRELFAAALALPVNPAAIVHAELDGDPGTLAARLLSRLLSAWDTPEIGGPLVTMGELALGDETIRRLVAEAIAQEVGAAIAEELPYSDRRERAATFAALVSGVIFSRYLLAVEPFASMEPAEVVRRLTPPLQAMLTG